MRRESQFLLKRTILLYHIVSIILPNLPCKRLILARRNINVPRRLSLVIATASSSLASLYEDKSF